MHIAAQAVELRHGDMGTELLGLAKGSGELWALVERIGTLAALNLDKRDERFHINLKNSEFMRPLGKSASGAVLRTGANYHEGVFWGRALPNSG